MDSGWFGLEPGLLRLGPFLSRGGDVHVATWRRRAGHIVGCKTQMGFPRVGGFVSGPDMWERVEMRGL